MRDLRHVPGLGCSTRIRRKIRRVLDLNFCVNQKAQIDDESKKHEGWQEGHHHQKAHLTLPFGIWDEETQALHSFNL